MIPSSAAIPAPLDLGLAAVPEALALRLRLTLVGRMDAWSVTGDRVLPSSRKARALLAILLLSKARRRASDGDSARDRRDALRADGAPLALCGVSCAGAVTSARAAYVASSLSLVWLAGCGRRDSAAGAPSPAASAAPAMSVAVKVSGSASSSGSPAPSASSAFGPWVRCYAHFRPTSTPLRDVTRLSILCGPQNGMHRLGDTVEGTVADVGPATEQEISLSKGQCVRVFAVGDVGITDLDVALLAPGGTVVAQDGIDDRWPILLPDRAVCAEIDGKYVVRVKAKKGRGRFAVSTWLLP